MTDFQQQCEAAAAPAESTFSPRQRLVVLLQGVLERESADFWDERVAILTPHRAGLAEAFADLLEGGNLPLKGSESAIAVERLSAAAIGYARAVGLALEKDCALVWASSLVDAINRAAETRERAPLRDRVRLRGEQEVLWVQLPWSGDTMIEGIVFSPGRLTQFCGEGARILVELGLIEETRNQLDVDGVLAQHNKSRADYPGEELEMLSSRSLNLRVIIDSPDDDGPIRPCSPLGHFDVVVARKQK